MGSWRVIAREIFLTAVEIANAHHKLEDTKVTKTVTPMDMEVYPHLSKRMKNARALRLGRKSCPEFEYLDL